MVRLLALLLLAILFWLLLDWLYRKTVGRLGSNPRSGRERGRSAGSTAPRSQRVEPLVRCASCASYVPSSRALSVGRRGGGQEGEVACSELCRHRLRTGKAG